MVGYIVVPCIIWVVFVYTISIRSSAPYRGGLGWFRRPSRFRHVGHRRSLISMVGYIVVPDIICVMFIYTIFIRSSAGQRCGRCLRHRPLGQVRYGKLVVVALRLFHKKCPGARR